MGKKMKSNSEMSNSDPHEADEGVESRGPCNHCPAPKGGAQLDRILSQLRYSPDGAARCEECRISSSKKRGIKELEKPPKKRAGSRATQASSDTDFIWVCLDCTRCYCGGAASGSVPCGHARRHAKTECHLWAVRSDSPDTCWCFSCNSLVLIKTPQELDVLAGSAMEVENAGNALVPDNMRGYTVRGLVNLGNTCFFNSVMQNLLAMGILRGFLARLAQPFGALTMELMNLFIQTETSWNSYGSLNPSEVFRCICISAPQFMGYEQQDSHELLRYLLDGLHTEEIDARRSLGSSNEQDEGVSSNEATMVDAIFGGQLSSTVSCVDCGHTSVVHERFLDLSLPVPSKKPSTKKGPLPTSKKNRLPAREGKRGNKVRRKRIAKESPEVESRKMGDSNSPSECNESCAPASEQKHMVEVGVEGNFVGMDYVTSFAILDTADSVSQKSEVPIAQCSESGQIYEAENSAPYSSDPQIKVHCPEQIASSDSCGASTCRDDNPSSCTQDSDVLQIPHSELDSTVPETSKMNQKNEKAAYLGSALKESNEKTTSVAGCEEIDAHFEGVGDLYNDLEVTSDLNRETGMGQQIGTTLLADNTSESNQDEVDDTSAPVSVDSCLSLFTKPEFLSDEHAWHCDLCSEKASHEEHRRGKRQADERHDNIVALMSVMDGGEIRSKRTSASLGTDSMDPTDFKVSDNGNVIASSEDLDLHTRMDHDQSAAAEIPQKLLRTIERSSTLTCKYGLGTDMKSLDLSNPTFIGKECPDILQKNEDFAGLYHALQYVACPSQHEACLLREKLSKDDSDCCSTDDQSSVGCVRPDLPAVSSNSPDHTETVPQSSCDNDNVSEVNQVGRQYSPLKETLQPVNDSQGEEMGTESKKVKRKATKRILINWTPPILTIHLKRFNQDARGRLNKLRGHISFGEILDLRPYMDPRCAEKERCYYHLVGLVEHSGTMTRGHYVAYVRGERSQSKAGKSGDPAWFYASDAHVREVSLSEVLRSDAYILFYEKVWC